VLSYRVFYVCSIAASPLTSLILANYNIRWWKSQNLPYAYLIRARRRVSYPTRDYPAGRPAVQPSSRPAGRPESVCSPADAEQFLEPNAIPSRDNAHLEVFSRLKACCYHSDRRCWRIIHRYVISHLFVSSSSVCLVLISGPLLTYLPTYLLTYLHVAPCIKLITFCLNIIMWKSMTKFIVLGNNIRTLWTSRSVC